MNLLWSVVAGLLLGLAQPQVLPGVDGVLGPRWIFAVLAYLAPLALMRACEGAGLRRRYGLGLIAFGLGNALTFAWMVVPVVTFGHLPAVVGLVGVLFVAAILTLPSALIPLAAARLRETTSLPAWILWPSLWCAHDLLREFYPFNGFPWGDLGTTQVALLPVAQLASVVGAKGVTFFVVLTAALIHAGTRRTAGMWWPRRRPLLLALGLVALVVGSGLLRLRQVDARLAVAPTLLVAVLQGNIDQETKNKDQQHLGTILKIYQSLQKKAEQGGARLVVWPEAAHPTFFDRSALSLAGRGFGNSAEGVVTAAGVVMYERDPRDFATLHLFNSLVFLDHERRVLGVFHKQQLVPFGEYVPWPLASVVKRLVPGTGMFERGPLQAPVVVGAARVGGLICYEGVFGRYSRELVQAGATLLLNVTNDAWYGRSAAPFQHLAFYQMRAIESGRAIVRAANTGISALVLPSGRLGAATRLNERGVLPVDAPLLKGRGVFVVVGDTFAWLCALAVLALLLLSFVPGRPCMTAPDRLYDGT